MAKHVHLKACRPLAADARAKAEDQGLYTLEQHMNELMVLRDLAKSNSQIRAAVAAEVKRGELMGC